MNEIKLRFLGQENIPGGTDFYRGHPNASYIVYNEEEERVGYSNTIGLWQFDKHGYPRNYRKDKIIIIR